SGPRQQPDGRQLLTPQPQTAPATGKPGHNPGLAVILCGAPARPRQLSGLSVRHVDKSRIMTLECDGHSGGRTVPVLGHDQVRLTSPRRLSLICILTMQKNHNIRILLDAVVTDEAIGDEVVGALHCGVIDGLWSEGFDADDPVPVEVAAGDLAQRPRAEYLG